MMKTIEQKMIAATAIHPHAHNREFPTTGEDWLAFVADVAEKGVLVELVQAPPEVVQAFASLAASAA